MPVSGIQCAVEQKMNKSIEALKKVFTKIRAGRAHPSFVYNVHVD